MPVRESTRWPSPADLAVKRLGECRYDSPLATPRAHEPFVDEGRRVLLCGDALELGGMGTPPPSFEPAGPRARIFFEPETLTCGILTCGGLCPGLNNVVRAIVLSLTYGYGVRRILGFRYGYAGLAAGSPHEPLGLTPEIVDTIHLHGGTLLGSSRGR